MVLVVHADRPSLTATVVSFARGALSRDANAPCFDPVAAELVPTPFTQVLRVFDLAGERRKYLEPFVRVALAGIADHVELRTAIIDGAVRDAVGAGVTQLVILGAGLDGRAWRMSELREVTVFEVDHPATQAWKMGRVNGRSSNAKDVHFVAVDFERTSLQDALSATSHDPARPTFWIWEGVTPYLNESAIDASLEIIAKRSAKKSRLAVTYVTPDVISSSRIRQVAYPVLRVISEPLIGIFSQDAMAKKLSGAGFDVLSDELPADVGPRYGRTNRRRWASPSERVIIAER